MMPEYYFLVFADISERRFADIEHALIRAPADFSRQHWSSVPDGDYPGEAGWNLLKTYLDTIEQRMAAAIRLHSVYFWMHLYRRIGVELHPGHANRRDETTISLVRQILELAISKYGELQANSQNGQDIFLATEVAPEKVLGGLLVAFAERKPGLWNYIKALSRSRQWVMTRFSENDLVAIYGLEGLAYEYWLTSARMRTVGKVGKLTVRKGSIQVDRTDSEDFLLESFDARNRAEPFASSNIGVGFFGEDGDVLLPIYNVKQLFLEEVPCPFPAAAKLREMLPNFIYGRVDLRSYYRSHKFLENEFKASRGFNLASFLAFMAAISDRAFADAIRRDVKWQIAFINSLYRRAMYTVEREIHWRDVTLLAGNVAEQAFGVPRATVEGDAQRVREALTLTDVNRSRPGLWSRGPRFPLIPISNNGEIADLAAINVNLKNAFVGVKYEQTLRGTAFEDAFRETIERAGLSLLHERILKRGELKRETDAAVRVDTTLYLCDCRSIEMPLDHDLGKPATLAKRRAELVKKMERVHSIAAFVQEARTGNNYDFSWATRIVSIAVSPFVEFLWSNDGYLWFDQRTPRLLSAIEAVRLMKEEGPREVRSGSELR